MIPQIIYNVRQGNNPGFEPLYTIGYMGVRVLVPFYERACPNNHFMLTPIYGLVGALFALYFVQVTLFIFRFWFYSFKVK